MSDGSPVLRAGDADRERAIEQLRLHAAEGRLQTEELEARVHAALAARTLGELEPLLHDLPRLPGGRSRARPRVASQQRLRSILPLAILLIAIWALTGMGYFWPVWPLLGVGFMAFGGGGRHVGCGQRRRSQSVRGSA